MTICLSNVPTDKAYAVARSLTVWWIREPHVWDGYIPVYINSKCLGSEKISIVYKIPRENLLKNSYSLIHGSQFFNKPCSFP